MKIVIIGDGKVGHKLAQLLSEEQGEIVLVDQDEDALRHSIDTLDIMGIQGDGVSYQVQEEAGVPEADLVIACTSRDEMNMLICLLAKRLGAEHTIARVRNPIYYQQMHIMKKDLHLNMAVNPEFVASGEILRVLIFPSAIKMESFAKGRVELVEFKISEQSKIAGMSLEEIYHTYKIKILVCAVQRGKSVYIPTGSFILEPGDKINLAASHREIEKFFKTIGNFKNKVRSVIICGGSRIAFYLASQLLPLGVEVKIIEKDKTRCEELCDKLPKASIIHGDATEQNILIEEGMEGADAVVTLTGIDEENIIMSILAKSKEVDKVITKINSESLFNIVEDLGLDSVISPKNATANVIAGYVRAMKNSISSSNVETIYRLIEGKIEAVEFFIKKETSYLDIPLKTLEIKKDILIACIVRKRRVIIPGGEDVLQIGDSVIVITMDRQIQDLEEILV